MHARNLDASTWFCEFALMVCIETIKAINSDSIIMAALLLALVWANVLQLQLKWRVGTIWFIKSFTRNEWECRYGIIIVGISFLESILLRIFLSFLNFFLKFCIRTRFVQLLKPIDEMGYDNNTNNK